MVEDSYFYFSWSPSSEQVLFLTCPTFPIASKLKKYLYYNSSQFVTVKYSLQFLSRGHWSCKPSSTSECARPSPPPWTARGCVCSEEPQALPHKRVCFAHKTLHWVTWHLPQPLPLRGRWPQAHPSSSFHIPGLLQPRQRNGFSQAESTVTAFPLRALPLADHWPPLSLTRHPTLQS